MSRYKDLSLSELAARSLLKNKHILLSVNSADIVSLNKVLNSSVSHSLLNFCMDTLFLQRIEEDTGKKLDVRKILEIYRDIEATKLHTVSLRGYVKDSEVFWMVQHPLKHLDFSESYGLSNNILHAVNEYCSELKSLYVGSVINFANVNIPEHRKFRKNYFDRFELDTDDTTERAKLRFGEDYVFDCPKLERVSATFTGSEAHSFVAALISRCPSLVDLSLEDSEIDVDFMDCIEYIPNLTCLNLHNVRMDSCIETFNILKQLQNLRHLDLSVSDENPVIYEDAEGSLLILLRSNPRLTSLDISGTNLLCNDSPVREPYNFTESLEYQSSKSKSVWCYIEEKHPMDFLGLLDCANDPCYDRTLAAKEVSGLANEQQIVSCLKRYQRRPILVNKALNALFLKVRREGLENSVDILQDLLDILLKNKNDLFTMIRATASLFYVVRECRDEGEINTLLRKNIIRIILTLLEDTEIDLTVLRNSVLILHLFTEPDYFLFVCRRFVTIICSILKRRVVGDAFVERYFLHILNGLACTTEMDCKSILGELGVVECLLQIITRLSVNRHPAELVEWCFSILWNVTDETPSNCKRFLESEGLTVFAECYEKYDAIDLYRNMTGLLGNVAEVSHLRDQLRSPSCLKILDKFIDQPEEDSLEVSYNTIGILAHIMCDGFAGFSEAYIEPDICCERIYHVIKDRWKLDSSRMINYRSFSPILALVPCSQYPIVQLWSVWALANLTTSNGSRYLPMLERDGGVPLLNDLLNEPDDSELEAKVRQHGAIFVSWRQVRAYSKVLAENTVKELDRFKNDSCRTLLSSQMAVSEEDIN